MSGMLERQKSISQWRVALGSGAALFLLAALAPPAGADQVRAQSVHDAQWPLQLAQPQKVWALSKGQDVTVAVIDSGVDASHPDLRGRVTGGGDFGDGASGDGTQDAAVPRGHGTELASLVAGTGRNFGRHGLLGLAPEARVLSFGVYRNGQPDQPAVAKAIGAAVDRGAEVILLPALGSAARSAVVAAVHRAMDHDVVVISGVGSPGSGGTTTAATVPSRPVAVRGVVTVAAVDRQGKVWPEAGSGRGAALAAPGVDVLAASPDRTYWTGSDSAFAASWVAGAAALIRAAHPHWTADQTITKLIDTAQRTGSGCTEGCGYGVVDPLRAVSDTAAPTARTNPLVTGAGPPQPVTAEMRPAVSTQRILLFVVSALAAMALYVAVTAVFIHRQRNPSE